MRRRQRHTVIGAVLVFIGGWKLAYATFYIAATKPERVMFFLASTLLFTAVGGWFLYWSTR